MQRLLGAIAVFAAGLASASAQPRSGIIDTAPIGPPLDPNQVIQQQNRPQVLPPAMAPRPYEFRVPSNGPYPGAQSYTGGSSYRARQASRARYRCAQRAKRYGKGRRAAYIRECMGE